MKDRIETRFTRDYGVRHPIALAPMAFVGTAPGLAIAVCNAGGVGSLAVGPLSAEVVRGLIRAVKAATDGPLNVNFITFLANQAQIQACIDEDVRVVSFHWGHPPREFVVALHEAGIKYVVAGVRGVPSNRGMNLTGGYAALRHRRVCGALPRI